MDDEKSESSEFATEYTALRGKQKAFTREIDAVLKRVIQAKGIDVVNVESRTKSLESFEEKCGREDKNYIDPMTQMTDLTGCRVICYYTSDIDRISKIIESNFQVDEENSVDRLAKDSPSEFGYQSKHLVVSFSHKRLQLEDFKEFANMKAEIQVRTSLQHSWAAIEHKLQYKNAQHIAPPLKRKLFRIAALLELADEEFNFLEKNIGSVRKEIKESIESGDLDYGIDVDSVDIFMISSGIIHEVTSMCKDIGFTIAPQHPDARRPIGKLIDTLISAEIKSVDELQRTLFKISPRDEWKVIMNAVYSDWKNQIKFANPVIDRITLVRIMVAFSVNEKIFRRILRDVPFGPKIQNSVQKVRKARSDQK